MKGLVDPMRMLFILALAALCAPATAAGAASLDALIPTPSQITLSEGLVPKGAPVDAALDPNLAELGEEGYSLRCDRGGYRLRALTERGLHMGRQSLNQMLALGEVPCCEIVDKPAMKMRAVMLDLARCKEKHVYYYHVIDQLARWKINTVFVHFTDDDGSALEIKRYPKLAVRNAFTQAEMRDLIRYAAKRHIELIPEVESWGHARYITRVSELAGLAESEQHKGTLCTLNPKVWEVLGHIYDEVAALFPSRYMHAGCDESSFGHCELCSAKVATDGVDALVGEHLRGVCELVKAKGKTPMIWSDILMLNRGATQAVPKDAIVCYWNYRADAKPEPAIFLKEQGFEVIGCPALVWGGRMILPMTDTLDNVRAMAKTVIDHNCLGMETTVWLPQRYITDTLSFGLAYAAELSWSGEKRERLEFAKAFARGFFGLEPTAEIAQTLVNIHGLAMGTSSVFTNVWNYRGQLDKLSDPAVLSHTIPARDRAKAISLVLKRYRPKVKSHQTEFDALILAADTSHHIARRAVGAYSLLLAVTDAQRFAANGQNAEARKQLANAADLLSGLIADEKEIAQRLGNSWDKWRYADDPVKSGGAQSLTAQLADADLYMKTILPRLRAASGDLANGKEPDWTELLREPAR